MGNMSGSSVTLFPLLIIALMFLSVARGRTKRLSLLRLWIFPLLFFAMAVQDIHTLPTVNEAAYGALLVAVAAGLAAGVLRARLMHFTQDSVTGEIRYANSMLSLLLYVAVILAKMAVRFFFSGFAAASVFSAALIVFALASMVGRRVFLTMKYLQMKNV